MKITSRQYLFLADNKRQQFILLGLWTFVFVQRYDQMFRGGVPVILRDFQPMRLCLEFEDIASIVIDRAFAVGLRFTQRHRHGPKRLRYSLERMNALTISALTKLPLKAFSFVSQKS